MMQTPPSTGNELVAVGIAATVVETLVVALRFIIRYRQKSAWDWDDLTVHLAYVFTIAMNAICISIVYSGDVGLPVTWVAENAPGTLVMYFKLLFAVEEIYIVATTLAKVAILCLYLRFFRKPMHRQLTKGLIIFICTACVADTIAWATQCIPTSYFWNNGPGTTGQCFNRKIFYICLTIPNLFTNLGAIGLAVSMVWNLHMSLRQRLGLIVVFLTGLLGTAVSLGRMTTFLTVDPFNDPTKNSVPLLIWTVAEPWAYIMVACLPLFRNVLKSRLSLLSTSRVIQKVRYGAGKSQIERRRDSESTLKNEGALQVELGNKLSLTKGVQQGIRQSIIVRKSESRDDEEQLLRGKMGAAQTDVWAGKSRRASGEGIKVTSNIVVTSHTES